ncbi:FAD-dependent oxidoreductase [Oceanicoccus sp. KOV_DT_Chl]|uniref:FAD-dependent oxidoreductase n=1 Tax=Oceanicoccus sp. KOV_DT_Chl TaxID=1904639 RepID=UPI000C7DEA28|nr:bifunctional TVP38/TMEM64 family protein/FAD-dependent oxidoreductase [Oceanicoccus sp. KOV_DT_Chl]
MFKKILLLVLLLLAVAAALYFDVAQYLTLEFFNSQRQGIADYQQQRPLVVALVYFVLYVLVTALSLPGAAVMTLVGGALFGLGWGLLIVSFASTIGATLAFLLARSLLHDWVQQRFAQHLAAINRGVEKDGPFYLFTLRLVPLFPFFVVNLVMALTPIKLWSFYWVSQVGMLAGTAVYVNAGTQLAKLDGTTGILSPALLASFVLLGLFPWLAKAIAAAFKARRAFSRFKKPRQFDNNVLVIGAGSAGLVSAYIAATVKAKVTLIEKNKMGGDCLNTGCVPSKAIIRSSRINHYLQRGADYGLKNISGEVDFPAVMQRVQKVIDTIEPHDSVARYTELGVDCLQGQAKIISPWQVEVSDSTGNKTLHSARNIIIASGGRPALPEIAGLNKINYLTSENIWQLRTLPQHLIVVGGGPIGCELAQAFRRLGSEVTMLVRSQLLPKEDEDVAAAVAAQFARDGIKVLIQSHIVSCEQSQKINVRVALSDQQEVLVQGDQLLMAVGRNANTEAMGLENVGVQCTANGTIAVDEYLRTDCPTIFACGDVAGPYQFTHVAAHQAWYAAVNALFGSFKKFKADYSVIPWVTFCDPEVARVGLSEKDAQAKNIAYEVTRYGIDDLDRAIADSEAHGFIKVLTVPGKDKILGVTIVGYHASELIAEYILAMRHGLGLNKVMGTIHIYPTLNEANKYVAGEWKKSHKPEALLKWVEKLHRLRR